MNKNKLEKYNVTNIPLWKKTKTFPKDYIIRNDNYNEWIMIYPKSHNHFIVKNKILFEGISVKNTHYE